MSRLDPTLLLNELKRAVTSKHIELKEAAG